MSKSPTYESVAPLPSETGDLSQDHTGASSTSTNPFRRSLAEKEHARKTSVEYTGSSTGPGRASTSTKPPAYQSQRGSTDIRKDTHSQVYSVPDRSSLDSTRYAPSAAPSKAAGGRPRRSSSLRERYPGDPSVRPLEQIARENKLAQRSPHLRKHHQPRPDVIDVLDDSALSYHHGGPYDAALLVRNSSYNSSPVAALSKSNAEALKATPEDKIRDSLNDHRPLDGTAMVPPGHRDAFGRLYEYEEGDDMQRSFGGDYKRYPDIKYLPEDLKGKGEPSFSIERALKEHEEHTSKYAGEEQGIEMVSRPRARSMEPSVATGTGRYSDAEPARRHGHSRSHNLSGEIKRRFGSLRRKDKLLTAAQPTRVLPLSHYATCALASSRPGARYTMKRAAGYFYLAVFSIFGPGSCQRESSQRPGHGPQDSCAIDPQAIVSDACTSFSTLDSLNRVLKEPISSLTKDTDFFSYYRLNLFDKECPFWSDANSMCGNIACAVTTIDNEEDIPSIWKAEELSKLEGPKARHPSREMQRQRESRPLLGELGADVGESCVVEYDDECDERDYCVPEDESATGKGDYVSLVDNPERFTGYSGPGARQVWEAIYRENCFDREERSAQAMASQAPQLGGAFGYSGQAAQGLRDVMKAHERQQLLSTQPRSEQIISDLNELDGTCLEKRTFYRIISGMHTSISTHLCWDYLDKSTGQWGPNVTCYEERLHHYPDRISNLYFNFALLLRALAKARPALQEYTYCTGDMVQDRETKRKVLTLADQIAAGPSIYDESLMFQDESVSGLKEEFRSRFRNVSRTMDCVGCDKCRLWGKVQTNGYGTALKILFEFDEARQRQENPQLRRTELVALVNTLDKVSHSLSAILEFESMLAAQGEKPVMEGIAEGSKKKKKVAANPGPLGQIALEFKQEFRAILNAFGMVMKSWIALPGLVWKISMLELGRLWVFYVGFDPGPRQWEIRRPGDSRPIHEL